jgi:Flp pilus assembly protein TadD
MHRWLRLARDHRRGASRGHGRRTHLQPVQAPGWSGLARTEAKLGHMEQAHDDMFIAVDLDPNNAAYYNSLGILEFQVKQYADAAESFQRALILRPRHMHARFNLGLALYQQRDFEGAGAHEINDNYAIGLASTVLTVFCL